MSDEDQQKYYNIVQKQQETLMSSITMSPKDRKRKQQIEEQIRNQPEFEVPIPSKQLTDKTATGLKPKIVGNGFKTYDEANSTKDLIRSVFRDIKQQQQSKEKIIPKQQKQKQQKQQKLQQDQQNNQEIQEEQEQQEGYYQYESKNTPEYKCKKCGKKLDFNPLFQGDQPQNLLCDDCIQYDTQQILQNIVVQPQTQELQQYDINQLQQQIRQKEQIIQQKEILQDKDLYDSNQKHDYDDITINEYKFELELLKQQLYRLQQQYKQTVEKLNLKEIESLAQQQKPIIYNLPQQFPFLIQKTVCPCCGEVTSVKLIDLRDKQETKQTQQQIDENQDKQKQLKLLYLQQIDDQLKELENNEESTVSSIQQQFQQVKTHQQNSSNQSDNLSISNVNSV